MANHPNRGRRVFRTYFQHPDTGAACGASYDPRSKVLTITTDDAELLRKSVPNRHDAIRELLRFGVDQSEAEMSAE